MTVVRVTPSVTTTAPSPKLLVQPASHWSKGRFVVAGPQYPKQVRWPKNVKRFQHLEPAKHREFYNAQRFTQVYEQYDKAKDITTERLYLDTMEEVLRNVNKVLVDKNTSGPGVLPYLPLPELKSNQPTGPQAPPRAGQPAQGATR